MGSTTYKMNIIIFSCILIVCLALGSFSIIHCVNHGRNITDEYTMYLKLKDITSTEKLKETTSELKLNYSLSDTKLNFNDYSLFYFDIEGKDCSINPDHRIDTCILLDEHSTGSGISCVIKYNDDGTSTETCTLFNKEFDCTKIGNEYYALHFIFYFAAILCSVFSIACSILLGMSIYRYRKNL